MKILPLTIALMSLIPFASFAGGSHGHGHHEAKASADHASGVGQGATAAEVTRTVNVALLDTMRFEFDPALQLSKGDVVRFKVSNKGRIRHEFSIGSESEQIAHRKMMQGMPNMVHEDANTVTVEPGQSKELIWKFAGSLPVVLACNIPGHAEAGMVVTVELH